MAYCRLGHIKENKGAGGMAAGLKNRIYFQPEENGEHDAHRWLQFND